MQPPDREPELLYGQNDVPPPLRLVLLSLQQAMLLLLGVMFAVVLGAAIGASQEVVVRMAGLTMIVSGLGTILQAVRLRWVGSGYLCPNVGGPSYLPLSIHAAIQGGLPLMQGMIVFAGFVEVVLARVVSKLRFLFPPLVVGLTVMMVGVSIVPLAFCYFCGSPAAGDAVLWQDLLVGTVALLVMVACNIWGRGPIKLYCLLIGMAVGWGLSLFVRPIDPVGYQFVREVPVFAIPFKGLSQFRLAFDWSLAVPFLIISVCGSLKSFGNLLAAQKITRPDLAATDMKPLVGGLTADGLSTALAGVVGAVAVDTSSSNVGLAAATRSVSRWIGVCLGVMYIIAGCFPVLGASMALIPHSVVGAAILFAVCFMILTGVREMLSDELDQRKISVAGLAMSFGLSTAFVPEVFAQLPRALQPLFSNPLITTTILGIVLYQVFHIDVTLAEWRGRKSRPGVRPQIEE